MNKIKVMLVEDNELARKLIKRHFLENERIEIFLEAKDGESAYKIIESNICDIDIILLDLIMPKKDGLYVLKKMKEFSLVKDVIIMSAFGQEDVIIDSCKYGVKYFMLKPFDFVDLENKIIEVINNKNILYKHKIKKEEIVKEITPLLRRLGFPTHIKGYLYIKEAITMICNEPKLSQNITRCLYNKIAESFGTSKECVERAIRHAIEISWNRGDIEVIDKVFGCSIDMNKSKPTNSEYITAIVELINLGKVNELG